jgi:hypothetical protein
MALNKATFAGALILASVAATTAEQARAAYAVDLTQKGSNVVATGSGTINLGDLTFLLSQPGFPEIFPSEPGISLGADGEIDVYGVATPPVNFGSGGGVAASTGSGDLTIAAGPSDALISVPAGYVSGSPLSGSATWDNQTFISLGVTPGTYKWAWGSGADADSFTLIIGTAGIVPEPSTWAMVLLGFVGLGFASYRRRWAWGSRLSLALPQPQDDVAVAVAPGAAL